MDPTIVKAMFRFNTWANENIRDGLETADETVLRRPLDFWYGSVFNILAHICGGETVWLARLRDADTAARAPSADSFPSVEALVTRWRTLDTQWEDYVSALSAEKLESEVTTTRRDGGTNSFKLWQPVMQIAFHGTEHRGHATVAMTLLGIKHGPQDFIDQFR